MLASNHGKCHREIIFLLGNIPLVGQIQFHLHQGPIQNARKHLPLILTRLFVIQDARKHRLENRNLRPESLDRSLSPLLGTGGTPPPVTHNQRRARSRDDGRRILTGKPSANMTSPRNRRRQTFPIFAELLIHSCNLLCFLFHLFLPLTSPPDPPRNRCARISRYPPPRQHWRRRSAENPSASGRTA